MASQPGQQSNCNAYIDQYLKNKGNQTLKFGQLKEFDVTNNFFEKSYTTCGGETISQTLF